MKCGSFLKRIFLIILLTSITGCLTTRYYDSDLESRTYHETIRSFLITEDGSKLVVLGEKYHYIFDANTNLKKILLGNFKSKVVASFSNYYVTKDNKITGNYTLWLCDATEDQKKDAINAGFIVNMTSQDSKQSGNQQGAWTRKLRSEMTLSGNLEGVRYSAEGFPSIAQIHLFNVPYYIDITEEQSASNLAKKILVTPILVLADGVLILGSAALMLFIGGCGGCG